MTTDADDKDGGEGEGSAKGERAGEKAKEELFEAIEHFKNAAGILFARAQKDPTIRTATAEAGKVFQKLGETAEPLAKQLTNELGKLTKTITEAVDGKRKSEVPPPAEGDEDTDPGTAKP
jgi:hypothetical protein